MALKFREIEVFWAVYRSKSVKDAARLLNVSQPAVSMMLKSAEERFGIRLFSRYGGRVQPTSEARHLFAFTENLFLDLHEFERQLVRLREGRAGSVSVSATPTLAASFLHPALVAFAGQHAGLGVTVYTVPTEQTLQMVERRRVDFGIAYGPLSGRDVDLEDLARTQVACIFQNSHPLARKRLVTPADLVGETIASYRQDTPLGRELERALRAAETEIVISIRSTALTAAQLANRGLGVALVDPFILSGGLFPDLTVRPFEPATTAHVQIVTPKGEGVSTVGQNLIDEIRRGVPRQFSFAIPIHDDGGSG